MFFLSDTRRLFSVFTVVTSLFFFQSYTIAQEIPQIVKPPVTTPSTQTTPSGSNTGLSTTERDVQIATNRPVAEITTTGQSTTGPSLPQSTSKPDSTWSKFEKLFIFGDSWSNTEFNWSSTQPSPDNPMGNPNYTRAGIAANGGRWPIHLTFTYNQSLLETYALARVAAVIDTRITPHGMDLLHQIDDGFLPVYGNSSNGKWDPQTALFITFFAVNDVSITLGLNDTENVLDRIFASYGDAIIKLYDAGARNFLLINSPPMDLAPNHDDLPGLAPMIKDFNNRITLLITGLASKYHSSNPYTSMNLIQYDLHSLFTSVIANPSSNPITAGIKNTTGWCPAYYDSGRPHGADFFDKSCGGIKYGEYLWLNAIHPTVTMYEAIADGIAKVFGA